MFVLFTRLILPKFVITVELYLRKQKLNFVSFLFFLFRIVFSLAQNTNEKVAEEDKQEVEEQLDAEAGESEGKPTDEQIGEGQVEQDQSQSEDTQEDVDQPKVDTAEPNQSEEDVDNQSPTDQSESEKSADKSNEDSEEGAEESVKPDTAVETAPAVVADETSAAGEEHPTSEEDGGQPTVQDSKPDVEQPSDETSTVDEEKPAGETPAAEGDRPIGETSAADVEQPSGETSAIDGEQTTCTDQSVKVRLLTIDIVMCFIVTFYYESFSKLDIAFSCIQLQEEDEPDTPTKQVSSISVTEANPVGDPKGVALEASAQRMPKTLKLKTSKLLQDQHI